MYEKDSNHSFIAGPLCIYRRLFEFWADEICVSSLAHSVVICLPNMVYAFFLPRLGTTPRQLLFWNMVLKLCNIPVFVGVFLVALLLNIMVIPLLPFLMLFDYSLLLPSTMYGISGIWQNYRKGKFSLVETAVNIILHFFFCADVFSSIYCYVRGRKVSQ